MQNITGFAAVLAKEWSNKNLEELRIEAERQKTGIAFTSLRSDQGQRFIVIICVTDIDQIERLEKKLELVDDEVTEDWNKLSLAEVAMRSMRAGGLCFESLKDEYGRRCAVILVATNPDSIKVVEAIFETPR